MVVPAPADVVPEVPAIRMQPRTISLAAIAADGSPIAHQPVAVGSYTAAIAARISGVGANVAAIRTNVARVVTDVLPRGRTHRLRRRRGCCKNDCHRGAKRRYS
ncbi:MAG TPA: hypothetical protein VLD17_11150 [Gemmatimonadaceae bacterium]|nr:hypothetical protein [Gemmatimonadaceae bacterium]